MTNTNRARDRIIAGLIFAFFALFVVVLVLRYSPWGTPETQPEPVGFEGELPLVEMQLETGNVLIELRPDLSPQHTQRILALTGQGFYDGVVFHRVIDGFMAQTGDPTGTGMGSSDLPDLPAEFTDAPFVRGVLGMARSSSPNSANSQFFIVLDAAQHLNGQYTVVGEVIEGMEMIDGLKKGDPRNNGMVEDPDHIVAMRVMDSE